MPDKNVSRLLPWLRNGLFAITDQALIGGAGLFLALLLGRWLSPTEYGAYALAFSIFLAVSGLYNALLLEPMSVLGPGAYRHDLRNYFVKILYGHLGLTLLLSLLLALVGVAFQVFRPGSQLPLAFFGASVGTPAIPLYWLLRRWAYLEVRPALAVRGSLTYASTLVALLLLFQNWRWLSPFTAFLLQAASSCLAGGLVLAAVWKPSGLRPPRDLVRKMLKDHWQ